MKNKICVFWFRRDLRLTDNAGLYYALKYCKNVLPIFIFDSEILDQLECKKDKRVEFIYSAVNVLYELLQSQGTSLLVLRGRPADVFQQLLQEYAVEAVYTNHDYEPYAINRDKEISLLLKEKNILFKSYKDQVIFERDEVTKDDGLPYTVFTPYSKKWKVKLNSFYLKPYPSEQYCSGFFNTAPVSMPSLEEIGFQKTGLNFSLPEIDTEIIAHYKDRRDFPAMDGTTRFSVHLRFGTISIRKLAGIASLLSETWLNELIWREFYMCILCYFPHVAERSFKSQYDFIEWRNNTNEFECWCKGQTGYPIVDAGMRELNETGFMHNRVRMIVASFLTKHLLIDWRWGEAYFAEKLLDYDLSANNGGWQWAAGSGCDAAPYFRIFNPYEQTKKFDENLEYIRKWVPESEGFNYPQPIVDHKFARERVLQVYKKALQR